MTSTLQSTAVSAVLQRMQSAEEADDSDGAADSARNFPADLGVGELAEMFKDVYMSVSSAGGELLYMLARVANARTVVEYGTSFGLSTIYLASAIRDNGGGTVIATELQADKAAAAQRNFDDAGVADLIDLRIGDACTTLVDVPQSVDLVLLDGWPNLALPVLKIVEPRLLPGALVVVDDVDVDWGADLHGPLFAHLSDGYHCVRLPIGDGIQVCLRPV